ncbi:ABC transporter permease subunit [Oscillochloris sp. ZM17-4]|uniref:ABC transporter permease n=1 Tax=Oscillochloris sp. ZM17-4 TaxID=2866714 RepID=UPI001C735095|nr:ABC transporter permease subunit [Oscillochloris sp. ZM17-4]MBX0331296.1 ABC transporter permease subunit [Oscillochloris sp. ZM17-4]
MTRSRDTLLIWLALAPALLVAGGLFGASLLDGVAQSLGDLAIIGERRLSLDAYAHVLGGATPAGREFWVALGFSLWVSGASTLLAAAGALLLAVALSGRTGRAGGGDLLVLNANLALPHLVWAIALLLLLAQSGLFARIAAALGLIHAPADFPVLVRDRAGLGVILHYVGKEVPFLALIVLAVLRTQGQAYDAVAATLGAGPWLRLRRVTLPLVLPGLAAGSLLVFAFTFGAYEVPALLGVRYPRALAVLALDYFANPDLGRRAEGMAISLIMSLVVVAVAGLGRALGGRREG